MFALTALEPLRKESRFRQTGSRISMQLKFRQAAGALANGSANWKMWDRKQVTPVSTEHPSPTPPLLQGSQHEAHQRRQVIWEGRSFRTKSLTWRTCWDPLLYPGPSLLPQPFTMKIFKRKENLKYFHNEHLFSHLPGSPSHSCVRLSVL